MLQPRDIVTGWFHPRGLCPQSVYQNPHPNHLEWNTILIVCLNLRSALLFPYNVFLRLRVI
jgi:hypothetical protein